MRGWQHFRERARAFLLAPVVESKRLCAALLRLMAKGRREKKSPGCDTLAAQMAAPALPFHFKVFPSVQIGSSFLITKLLFSVAVSWVSSRGNTA